MMWVSSSWPTELVISFFHQFELRALKSQVIVEQIGISLFILLRSKSKFTQKKIKFFIIFAEERYVQVKKHFSLCEQIRVTKQLSKVHISSRLVRNMVFVTDTNTTSFESLGWSDLTKLYPSIKILVSLLSIEEFRKVSDKHYVIVMLGYICLK